MIVLPAISTYVAPVIIGVLTGASSYGGYQLIKALNTSYRTPWDLGSHYVQNVYKTEVEEKKQRDERLPKDPDQLLEDSNWQETSHPNAKEKGHRTFENKETGEKLRYDEAKLGETGHKGRSHWHRYNPESTRDIDRYLDTKGNPVPDGHPDSHLYP